MGRQINGAKWEAENPSTARALRELEGKTLPEMADATRSSVDATRKRCRALGIKYAYLPNPTLFNGRDKVQEWRPPQQYPSVWHWAHGVTLRDMQGARA
jgi:hypothetical protein